MNPIEEYFFDNNIEVWSKKISDVGVYYNTSDGEYFSNYMMKLFKINGNVKQPILLKKEPVSLADDTSH